MLKYLEDPFFSAMWVSSAYTFPTSLLSLNKQGCVTKSFKGASKEIIGILF